MYFTSIASKFNKVRGNEILDTLLDTVKFLHNGTQNWVLDVGAGTGRFSIALTKKGFRIIGIDRNAQMLSHAVSNGNTNNQSFEGVLGAAENLPFPENSFYLIVSTNAIHHFNLHPHFQEISRILKPGGYYIIFSRFHEQNVRSIWGQYFPLFAEKETRLYNPEDFKRIENYFPQIKLESIEELKFEVPFSANRLINEAKSNKYSTFALYTDEEFKQAFKKFQIDIAKYKCDVQKVETGRIIFRKKLIR